MNNSFIVSLKNAFIGSKLKSLPSLKIPFPTSPTTDPFINIFNLSQFSKTTSFIHSHPNQAHIHNHVDIEPMQLTAFGKFPHIPAIRSGLNLNKFQHFLGHLCSRSSRIHCERKFARILVLKTDSESPDCSRSRSASCSASCSTSTSISNFDSSIDSNSARNSILMNFGI